MRSATTVVLTGLVTGVALLVLVSVGFRLLGPPVLFNRAWNSDKFVTVWTELNPPPMFVARPIQFAAMGLIVGLVYAATYHWLRPVLLRWHGIARGWRFGVLMWLVSVIPTEIFIAQNLLYETLIASILESIMWVLIFVGMGMTASILYERAARGHFPYEGNRYSSVHRTPEHLRSL